MENIFLELIKQLNSSVVILMLILVITCFTVYKLGYWTHKFASHNEKVNKLENLAEQVIFLTTKVDLIYQNTNPNAPLRARSPLSLTDIGNTIIENIRAHEIFDRYAEELTKEVEKMTENNAYDIQQACLKVARTKLMSMLNEQELIAIKEEAYKKGILAEDVMDIFGILLRNHILNLKKISISEVDKHTPNL